MSLSEMHEPDAIKKAVDEFDDLGRTAFLERYGFGPSRDFFLIVDGRQYDSKAIVGAAHGYEFPDKGPLTPSDFSGGVLGAAKVLRSMNFNVVGPTELHPGVSIERSPLHIFLRWNPSFNRDTINLHMQVAAEKGSVWWGKRGDPARPALSSQRLDRLQEQIQQGIETHVYLLGGSEAWRANALDVAADQSQIDGELIPAYYGSETHNLWLRLTDFQATTKQWLTENLILANSPIPKPLSLRGQSTLILVREGQASQPIIDEETHLSLYVEEILSGYSAARMEEFGKRHALWGIFERLAGDFERVAPVQGRDTVQVKWSAGQGVWAKVPWISFLDARETTSTQRGVYCVVLFREDLSGAYLTFNQGVTEPKARLGGRAGRAWLRQRASQLREDCAFLSDYGFVLDDKIDLRTTPGLGADYEDSTIAYKLYEAGAVPSDNEIVADLEAVLTAYDQYLERMPIELPQPLPDSVPAPIEDLAAVVAEFEDGLAESHISFGSRHHDVVAAFVASLATKRFAILTGLSGSGKTQIALRFGDWLGNGRCALVPVRPDWTGAEALFGFEDALQPARDGRRAWQVPPVLEFMLSAGANALWPHLLILDEMNLAHVERYFADALSGIESKTPVLPNLRKEDDGLWRRVPNAEPAIPLPRNLFIVGTVNVDETTYMFSPKVLDRANTFEFRVESDDLVSGLRSPVACAAGDGGLVRGFLNIAEDDQWHLAHPAPDVKEVEEQLRRIHRLLAIGGFEFGYRVFYEAVRFAAMLNDVGVSDPLEALDLQVMQKILPRLHGSRRRLEPTLISLAHFSFDMTVPDAATNASGMPFDPLHPPEGVPNLPRSFAKLQRMTAGLRTNQFVSFIE